MIDNDGIKITKLNGLVEKVLYDKYPILKESWILVQESDKLDLSLRRIQKSPLNNHICISHKLIKLRKQNGKRHNRRLRSYYIIRRMVAEPNQQLFNYANY